MNADYASRQLYVELYAAGYSPREIQIVNITDTGRQGVRVNPLDRPLMVVVNQDVGRIRMRYWHDLDEAHEGVPPFHTEYAPDYETMLQLLH